MILPDAPVVLIGKIRIVDDIPVNSKVVVDGFE
jgi:hypothetical protein